jgi:ABC-type Na+ efflux pump permease subunit
MNDSNQHKKMAPKSSKRFFQKNRLVIGFMVIVIIILGFVGGWIYISNQKSTNETKVDDLTKVYAIVSDKGYDAGKSYLENELKKTNKPSEQAEINKNLAIITGSVSGGNSKGKALVYAYKAEKLHPSGETAMIIATFEEFMGNIQKAIKYYKLYLERMPKSLSTQSGQSDYDYYATRVSELEAGLK